MGLAECLDFSLMIFFAAVFSRTLFHPLNNFSTLTFMVLNSGLSAIMALLLSESLYDEYDVAKAHHQ